VSEPALEPSRPLADRLRPARRVLVLLAAWVAVAVPVTGLVFDNSSRTTVLASHEAVIRPSFDGWVEVSLGPFLPSFRYPTGSRLGAEIELGKTSLTSYEALVRRYASIAGQPDGQISKLQGAIREMAVEAVLVGGLVGLVPPGLWLLLGPRRRHDLVKDRRSQVRTATVGAAALTVLLATLTRPWDAQSEEVHAIAWQPITTALPDVPIPGDARPLQVDAGLLTEGTRRLVASALDSYRRSSSFYDEAAGQAAGLAGLLREPRDDETVALLVSDRHDNIGMDPVARAIADAGGASFLLDAGDDTSTGSEWEAFSLESLAEAFADYEYRFHVSGNHDHGGFISEQAAELGFTPLAGEVVEGPDGIRLLGADDPRSSGLGNWRDETGLSSEELTDRIGDTACAADEEEQRISTLLVHDADNGDEALRRGCVDLVVAGHLHVVVGPDRVVAENGAIGHTYTTGTTGGAAYAIAIGTKPRRDAVVSLVTYREGRPVGVQWVSLSPLGDLRVGAYTRLDRGEPELAPRQDGG
jgi:hypothetical protein